MQVATESRKKRILATINGEDMTTELHAFAVFVGLEAAAPDRYSTLCQHSGAPFSHGASGTAALSSAWMFQASG